VIKNEATIGDPLFALSSYLAFHQPSLLEEVIATAVPEVSTEQGGHQDVEFETS
jgi:hypothetical protein